MPAIASVPDEDDTRKVQTAVVGGANSSQPVFLPYDHDGFDRFMRGRSRDDFYCGTLLGGCGKVLTVRRSEVKKCHFAHRPPVNCRRTAVGEESADHLYIGQALRRWLQRQGHQQVTVNYPNIGSGPGGVVEVCFDSARRLIRVQIDHLSLRDWQTARERTHHAGAEVHWSYGPGSGLAHNEASQHGHAVRFECRTVGETREVYVGTQFKDHSVEWVPLAEAHLDDTGFVTPRLAEQVGERAETETQAVVAFPLLPGSIAFTGTVEVTAPGDESRLYEADVQPRGSVLVRARISLPRVAAQPQPHRLHVIDGIAHLSTFPMSAGTDANWLIIHADGCSPLAERTDPRWPDLRPPKQVPEVRAAVEVAAPELGPAPHPDTGATSAVSLVKAFRARLTQVARSRSVINWETLVSTAGASPSDFTAADRIRLLVAVDYPRAVDKPVLSSLVKLRGESPGPPSFFADILGGLGRDAARDQGTLAEVHQRELVSAYAIVRGESTDEVTRSLSAQEERRLAARKTVPAPRTSTVAGNRISAGGVMSPFSHNAAVKSVRRALIDAAQHQRCVGWQFLAAAAGHEPEDITESRRIAILVAVDRANSASGVLLSSLVIGPGHTPVPYFDTILKQLGRPHGLRPIELGTVRKTEQARAFAAYRENPARMP